METQKIGIREFRDNLSTYLLNSEAPVAITRHGDTVGLYIPVRHKRTDEEQTALKEASNRLHQEMALIGISEDDILDDFKKWRKKQRS